MSVSSRSLIAFFAPGSSVAEFDRPETALGLRFFSLAIVAACGVFLPPALWQPRLFFAAILFGAICSVLQYLSVRRDRRHAHQAWILPAIATWTFLIAVSGPRATALFVGYFLEVLIAGLTFGSYGVVVATVASAVAIALLPLSLRIPYEATFVAPALGFLLVVALLSHWLARALAERRYQVEASQSALRLRAESLAEELRLLGDFLGGGLLAIDGLGRTVSLNGAGAEWLGVSTPVVGRPWQEVLPLDRASSGEVMRVLATGGEARGLPLIVQRDAAGPANVHADVWSGTSAEGPRTYVLFRPESVADEDGSDPLRRLGEAAACVSHQIKNSLHVLDGLTREIAGGLSTEPGGSADHLLRALDTLGQLSEDVLAMSGAPRSPEPRLPLHAVVASAVMLTRRGGARVDVDACDRPLYVRARRGPLVHALFNLIDNACRVAPRDAPVRVTVSACGDHAQVEIRDHGPGLPHGAEGAVRSTCPSLHGSGYGLLAARRFLESFGGALEFERPADGGTRCRVRLERSREIDPAPRPVAG